MKRILKLTESDLVRIIGKIINEQPDVDFLVKKSHNKIDELEFTEEDYFNYKECRRKKRTFPNYNPTEEEKVAYNKYCRQMAKGLDPAGPFKGKGRKEEPFTEEEYFNYKEYKRKKRTSPNYNPTEEERVAYNKYYRQKLKGLDAIAPFRKQQDPHIMEKIIRLTESDLVRIIGKAINEQPQKWAGQRIVRPILNKLRGQGGKQISKTAKLGQEIAYLRNQLQKFEKEEQLLMTKFRNKEINHQQYSSEHTKLMEKYNIVKVKEGIVKRKEQLTILKHRKIVANTPQENIIKSRYEAMRRGTNISQGGSNNLGVFDLGDGNVAKVSNKVGWADQGIGNLKWKDKIKSPRVMKTVEVKSFIDSKGKEVVYQIQQKAIGKPMDQLTKAELEKIPKEHLTNFKKDLEELYRNNIFVDPSKKSNFIYDPSKGIQFVDLGGIRKYKHTSAEEILDVLLKKW